MWATSFFIDANSKLQWSTLSGAGNVSSLQGPGARGLPVQETRKSYTQQIEREDRHDPIVLI